MVWYLLKCTVVLRRSVLDTYSCNMKCTYRSIAMSILNNGGGSRKLHAKASPQFLKKLQNKTWWKAFPGTRRTGRWLGTNSIDLPRANKAWPNWFCSVMKDWLCGREECIGYCLLQKHFWHSLPQPPYRNTRVTVQSLPQLQSLPERGAVMPWEIKFGKAHTWKASWVNRYASC